MAFDPLQYAYEWDIVRIGGVVCPGKCEISGFDRRHEWDVKKGKGVIGATVTYVGRQPAKGSIKFFLWAPIHFSQWDTYRKLFQYDPTKTVVTAIDIYHASLEDIGIKSVVCESIGMITRESGGLYSITVELLEYFPPPKKSAVSTPSGSSTKSPKTSTPGTAPDPVADAQQKEIARLLAEARKP